MFRIDIQAHGIRRLIGLHVFLLAVGTQQAQALQAFGPLVDGGETIEQLETFDIDLVAVRNPVLPLRARGGGRGRGHQAEVLGLPVGADHPASVEVIGAVFHVAFARRQHGEDLRISGGRAALLGRHRAFHRDADETVVAGTADAHVEAVVLFLVDQLVGAGRSAQHMGLHPHREQRLRIGLHVEQGLVVIGPDHVRRGVGDEVRIKLAGGQVLETDHVLAAADLVIGPGQHCVVLAHLRITDIEVTLARGHGVHVQQDFLRRLHRVLATRLHRVILAGLEARVVPVAALAIGHAGVVLLDAADDLVVEDLLQRLGRGQHGIGIGVLCIEVGEHRLVLALVVTQPVIVVVARGAERRLDLMRLPGSVGRRGIKCENGSSRQGHEQGSHKQEGGRFHGR